MKPIYFYLPDYPDWSSGGHKYHTILFEYFKKRRTDVFSFAHDKLSRTYDKNKLSKMLFGLYYTIKIPRKSIVVHSNTSFVHCFIPILLNKLWKKHYYFLIVHHLVKDEKPSYLRIRMEKFFIERADKVITISKTTRGRIAEMVPFLSNINIFSPGLDADINKDDYKKLFPAKLKLLYVGTIDERKGLKYLIEALSKIDATDFELNVIGGVHEQEYFEMIKETIKRVNLSDKVNFHSKVSKEQLKQFYTESSVFVFPSQWEGYGMVIAEAMAYGLPIIASKIPAIDELIEDGINGFMIDVRNSNAIAMKINILNTDKELMRKFSMNGIKKANTFPTWEKTVEAIYNELFTSDLENH